MKLTDAQIRERFHDLQRIHAAERKRHAAEKAALEADLAEARRKFDELQRDCARALREVTR